VQASLKKNGIGRKIAEEGMTDSYTELKRQIKIWPKALG